MLSFVDFQCPPKGTLAALLKQAYEPLRQCAPARWESQEESWLRFDHEAYARPEVARCIFLTYRDDELVGFGSFDPRKLPVSAAVGHHCILPAYQRRGFGRHQLNEILRRLDEQRASTIYVSTLDTPFFAPARQLYESAGFKLSGRTPWTLNPEYDLLHFQKEPPAMAQMDRPVSRNLTSRKS